MMNNLRVFVK
jgi:hypothetical protein